MQHGKTLGECWQEAKEHTANMPIGIRQAARIGRSVFYRFTVGDPVEVQVVKIARQYQRLKALEESKTSAPTSTNPHLMDEELPNYAVLQDTGRSPEDHLIDEELPNYAVLDDLDQ